MCFSGMHFFLFVIMQEESLRRCITYMSVFHILERKDSRVETDSRDESCKIEDCDTRKRWNQE